MSYNGTDLSPDPLFLQTGSYDARSDRKTTGDEISAGVVGGTDYAVTYSGGTLVMNVAAGVAYVRGGNIADQGAYRQYISAGTTVTLPPADPTNPRIDTIILRTFDNTADTSGLNKGRVEVVPGTPTVGATLSNLTGKNALTSLTDLSLSFVVLAYVLVPAGAATLTSTAVNVRDARVSAKIGSSSIAVDPVTGFNVGSGSAINTVTETDMFGVAGTGLSFPANFMLTPGTRYIIEAEGQAMVAATTAPTQRYRLYFGAANSIDTGAFALWTAPATSFLVPFELRIEFRYQGQSSTTFGFYGVSAIVNLSVADLAGTAIVAGNGTQSKSFAYKWARNLSNALPFATTWRFTQQWGTANANNQFFFNTYKAYLL